MDADFVFNPQKNEQLFVSLESCLIDSGELSPPKIKFIHDFADYFGDPANYQTQKANFENANVFAKIVNMLTFAKPPLLSDLLRLIMVYSRAEVNHRSVTKINGISMVLKSMQKFPTDFEVQEQGCRALINIGTTDKNRKVIAKEGGVEVVLDCLKVGTSSVTLCTAACWCLRNISVDDGNRKLIVQQNGLDLIVKAMRAFPTNLQLQTQACWALENIAIKDDTREPISSSGALVSLLYAMRVFPNDKKLQEACCWALSSLVSNSKAREIIRKESGVELLMAASKNFPNVETIQKYVADSISAISDASTESEDEDNVPSTPTEVKPSPQNLTIIRKGFLTKQGGRIKTWKKRWFVLDSSKLTYYKETQETHPLGTINLQKCEGVLEDTTTKKFCFMVVTNPRTYKILAPSRHEMAEWIVSIKNVIQELTSSNRPRSIDGTAFMKMEDKEKSKLLSPENFAQYMQGGQPKSADSGPISSLFSFTDIVPEERTPAYELEAVILSQVGNAIEKSPLADKIYAFENPDLLISIIARQITDEIKQNRLEDTYTKNIRGEKTEYVDALKVDKIVQQILDDHIQKILNDKNLLDGFRKVAKPYRSQVWGEQGIRKTMEDRHIAYPHINELIGDKKKEHIYSIYGIYDGHGGTRAADYICTHLHLNLMVELLNPSEEARQQVEMEEGVQLTPEEKEDTIFQYSIKKSFIKTNENFFESLSRQGLADACGSTAVLSIIRDKTIYVCWAGDSEAAMFYKDGRVAVLCRAHKATSESEKQRIEELGGFIQEVNGVQRLNGVLAVTRSFGDARFKRFVTSEPEIVRHTLEGKEDFLVLACDGLWDVMTPKDVGEFVTQYRNEKKSDDGLAEALAKRALELKSGDNISLIVVHFN